RAYVTHATGGGGHVSVIDTTANTVIATVPVGGQPEGVAVHPDGKRVYVANVSGPGTMSVIDTSTNTVASTILVGAAPAVFGQFIAWAPCLNNAACDDGNPCN